MYFEHGHNQTSTVYLNKFYIHFLTISLSCLKKRQQKQSAIINILACQ